MSPPNPSLIATIVLSVLCLLLAVAVLSDIRQRRIPNRLVLIGALAGIGCNSVLPEGYGFASALPGALGVQGALGGFAIGLVLMLPLYVLRAMGAGDVKLMAMVGAFLGTHAVIRVVLATFIVGGVLTLAAALRNRSLIPLLNNVHTMLLSSFFKLALHEMPAVDAPPVSAGRMPYGLAIAAGTMIYVVLKSIDMDFPWFLRAFE